jgi:hypothetical protein
VTREVVRFTTASPKYDGAETSNAGVVAYTRKPLRQPVRKVRIPSSQVIKQVNSYAGNPVWDFSALYESIEIGWIEVEPKERRAA